MNALRDGGWSLLEAVSSDVDALMEWFSSAEDIRVWGGPTFRFPFTRETFCEDIHWQKIASYCLRNPGGTRVAFGQLYDRNERIHLARLVVAPGSRGRGVGKRLVRMLMEAGSAGLSRRGYSLFVLRDNDAACRCYESLGFSISDYPEDMPHADICYYLTRPAMGMEDEHAS